jgi:hypothetical protein
MDAEAIRDLIRRKLHDRHLPHDAIRTVWSTPSDGETCDACDTVLTKDQLLMEGVTLDLGRKALSDARPMFPDVGSGTTRHQPSRLAFLREE